MNEPRRRRSETPRATLPARGTVRGVITVVQEDRFRLEDGVGRGYLFTLGRASGASVRALVAWNGDGSVVEVTYQGTPDQGAIATSVRVA